MRITITGAFGRLGQSCVKEAIKQGLTVNAFDIPSPANKKTEHKLRQSQSIIAENMHTFWGDIRNPSEIRQSLKNADAILHNAALLPPATENFLELGDAINVQGSLNVIEVVKSLPEPITILFPSSVTVFGNKQHLPAPRKISDDIEASDNYTRHKIECETALKNSGLPFVILRVGVSVDATLQGASKETLKALLNVSATNRMEYIHPDDTSLALINATHTPEAVGKTLLLGGGSNCQIDQLTFINATMGSAGIHFRADELGSEVFYTDWMDTELSQKLLNYQRISFASYQEQMQKKLRWVRFFITPIAPIAKLGLKKYLGF